MRRPEGPGKTWVRFYPLVLAIVIFPLVFWARDGLYFDSVYIVLYNFARAGGLIGLLLMFVQFSISERIPFLERGIGLDRLYQVHVRIGIVAGVLILLHALVLILQELVSSGLISLYFSKTLGIVAFLALPAAVLPAVGRRRFRLSYESWKWLHRLMYIVFPIGWFHSFLLGTTVNSYPAVRTFWIVLGAAFALLMLRKLLRSLGIRRRPWFVEAVDNRSEMVTGLRLRLPEQREWDHLPGQFVFLKLETQPGSRRFLEAHPFTVSSAPGSEQLELNIARAGDFTNALSSFPSGGSALVEGPYGRFSYRIHPAESYLFLAGGIGITPFLSMIRSAAESGSRQPMHLLWSVRNDESLFALEDLENAAASVPFDYQIFLTREGSADSGQAGDGACPGKKHLGRIDRACLEDLLEKKQELDPKRTAAFICGPEPMMNDLSEILRQIGFSRRRIITEQFSL
ncbi:MAG: ferric reductase-like transmembrane domain-containing protein [Spirochaetales bacterium]|nr:ferric reductase-like transmembrane domain-containing protein [Spirochaetales bacterium]MCF7939687.1 ferric reductase-like transmembrane domain-containing protein [Spirochaetales bacterium]